jgi:hypothetical protein
MFTIKTSLLAKGFVMRGDRGGNLPKGGVTLADIDAFIAEAGGESLIQGKTTEEMCHIMMEITKDCSYCEYLSKKKNIKMKDATVFISHAWKYNFLNVMKALRLHLGDDEKVVLWFDMFSVNEHTNATEIKSFGWWSTTFKSAMRNIKNVVVVVFPWDDPILFTRSWCIFEMFCAISTKCNFELTFTEEDRESLKTAGTDRIEAIVEAIDAEKSIATKPDDRELVKRTIIKYAGGMQSFNGKVRDKVKHCYLKMSKK